MLSKLHRGGEIQNEIEKIDNDLKTKKNTLSSNEQKEKKLEGDMRIIDKREKIKETQELYVKALKWQKFKTLRAQVKEARNKKRGLDEAAKDVEAKLIPTREFLKDYDKKVADIKADVDKKEKELQTVIEYFSYGYHCLFFFLTRLISSKYFSCYRCSLSCQFLYISYFVDFSVEICAFSKKMLFFSDPIGLVVWTFIKYKQTSKIYT